MQCPTKQLYDSAIDQVQRFAKAQIITVSGANMCTNMFIKRVPYPPARIRETGFPPQVSIYVRVYGIIGIH